MSCGYEGKACGALGCVLFLVERDTNWKIVHYKAVRVDGRRLKPGTFYTLKNNKVVKV